MQLTERIVAVLDALGVARAHVATQYPGDIAGLVRETPDRIGRVALVAPARIDATEFAPLGAGLLYIAPAGGMLAETAQGALPLLPGAALATLTGYDAQSWSDVAADRPEIVDTIGRHLAADDRASVLDGPEATGEIAGLRYRAVGAGPALLLTPLVLAPSQWRPVIPALAERFRVIELAGPKLGMLAQLEERAACPDWRQMCAGVFGALDVRPGDRVLDVGCGPGAVAFQFARRTAGRNPLTAVDLSAYFLGEARISAGREPLSKAIDFVEASAEALPFEDASFAAAYSITVLEECAAKTALAELVRVVKPGGRIGVVVRATDMALFWNMALPPEILAKIGMPAASKAPAGVASAALYAMAVAAGIEPIRAYPYYVAADESRGPTFTYAASHALSLLTETEKSVFRAARAAAHAAGLLCLSRGHHCFIGKTPG